MRCADRRFVAHNGHRPDHRLGAGARFAPGTKITRAYNSIYVIDHDGSVLSVYDKAASGAVRRISAVPGLDEKLGFVQLTKVQGGFIPGTRRRPMEIPNAPRALPLICYEAIFPATLRRATTVRAGSST